MTTVVDQVELAPHSGTPRARAGLHGHRFAGNLLRSAAAEAAGTFMLVLAIVATAAPATRGVSVAGLPYGSEAVALAGGFTLAAVVAGLGHVSGAHVNPAVTLGLAVTRRFPWTWVPVYMAAQLAGSVVAALLTWYVNGAPARSAGHLGATSPAAGVSADRVLVAEAIVTFVLMLVVTSVATDSSVPRAGAAIAIGLALAGAIFIAGPVSGAGVNPARALGPMIVAAQFSDWWAYIVGPIVGAVAAAVLYERVFRQAEAPVQAPPPATHDEAHRAFEVRAIRQSPVFGESAARP